MATNQPGDSTEGSPGWFVAIRVQRTNQPTNYPTIQLTNSPPSRYQKRKRIHRRPLPPLLHVVGARDREVEMRQVRRGIARGTDGAEDLTLMEGLPFGES